MMKRATRKPSTVAEDGRNSGGNFSTRFSLPSFVKRVEQLTENQKIAIKRTGFGSLLEIRNQMLCKNLLVELMERWSCEKHAFILLPGEITITLIDIALILGLRVTGDPIGLKEDDPFSDLEKEYGATIWNRKITIASIEKRLESLGGIVNDDFIRAFLLFTFGTFLFPNATGKVDSRYLSLLQDLDKVCQFAWGAAVLEDIFKWLCKRKEINVQYVGGCLIFLQMWSYEHIDIGRPSLRDCYLTFPRACRWENSRSHHRQWFTTKFKEVQDNQIIWELQLTSEESEIDIIKELLEAKNYRKELSTLQFSSTNVSIVSASSFLDGTKELLTPQYSSTNDIAVNMLEQQAVDSKGELEVGVVRELHEVQEDNSEQLRASNYVSEVLKDNMEHPSASVYVYEVQIDHMEHPSTSQNSFMNDRVDVQDDLRTKNRILEEQNIELRREIDDLRRENELLRNSFLSSPTLEEQNVELQREVDELRREKQLLSLSSNNLVVRLERLLFDEDTNATEET